MANVPVSHRAVLVALYQRAWKGKATDREVAAQAEINSSAEHGTMTVIKQLTPKSVIYPIQHAMTIGRQEHYRITVPGLFKGQALLATKMFEEYMLIQQECRDTFFKRVDDFLGTYPDTRDKAKTKLGTAYKESDFPSVSHIRSFFEYTVQPAPVPDVKGWWLDGVGEQDNEALRNEIEDGVRAMYNDATRIVYDKAKEAMERLFKHASNYSDDAPCAMLRDATVDHIKEICSLIGPMNVTGDPLLDKIGKEMVKEFSEIRGVELRRSADVRKDIAAKAKSILSKMPTVKRVAA